MSNSTLSAALSETRWQQAQVRETRYLIAQEKARLFNEQVADFYAGYDFSLDDFNTHYSNGKCCQCAMRLVSKNDPADRYLVICRETEGEPEWLAVCRPFHQHYGPTAIEAVRVRVANNSAARTQAEARGAS